jgi:hypothetical protein
MEENFDETHHRYYKKRKNIKTSIQGSCISQDIKFERAGRKEEKTHKNGQFYQCREKTIDRQLIPEGALYD